MQSADSITFILPDATSDDRNDFKRSKRVREIAESHDEGLFEKPESACRTLLAGRESP